MFDTPVGGSFTDRVVPLDANLSSTTTYTAGGAATPLVTATLDNETQRLTFPDPPASDLRPDIFPDDGTVTPGEIVTIIGDIANAGNRPATDIRTCATLPPELGSAKPICTVIDELEPGHEVVKRIKRRVKQRTCNRKLIATPQTAPCMPNTPCRAKAGPGDNSQSPRSAAWGTPAPPPATGIRISPTVRC